MEMYVALVKAWQMNLETGDSMSTRHAIVRKDFFLSKASTTSWMLAA